MPNRPGSVVSAMLWMFALSVLLFWIPLLGAMIAGFIGGRKAGSLGNAVLAVFLPGILFAIALFLLTSAFTLFPPLGFLAGAGAFVLIAAHVGPLLLGAILGAVT